MTEDKTKPLTGVVVLDLTSVVMGPYATQIMADLGATIFKIEGPGGDTTRHVGPGSEVGRSGTYLNLNRNKYGIGLDLKKPQAIAAVKQMAAKANVFMHSMRSDAIARLGLSYADLVEHNPGLIYVNGWGFGRSGPYEHKPSLDDIIQAATGIVGLTEEATGVANYVPTVLADKVSGLTILYAVLAALYAQKGTGRGVEIEVPMFESIASFLLCEHASGSIFNPARGRPVYTKSVSRMHHPFDTLDGRISVVLYTDKHWESFGRLVGVNDLLSRPSYATMSIRQEKIAEVYSFVATHLKTRRTEEWLIDFDAAGIPAMPVKRIDDLYDDPHLSAVSFFQDCERSNDGARRYPGTPVLFDGSRPAVRFEAPDLGEHNAFALTQLGISPDVIDELIACGALIGVAR